MGFLDIFKPKKKESFHLEVPRAPPSEDELPDFPEQDVEKKEVLKPASSIVKRIEKRAVKEQQELLDEREHLSLHKPIFMAVETFRDISEEIQLTSHILKENEDVLVRVSQFKEDQDKEFKKWESQTTDIQKKLIYVDKILFNQSERW